MSEEDSILLKISRMIKDEFGEFKREIHDLIKARDEDYKCLWKSNQDQEGRLMSLEKFRLKYETKIDNLSGQMKVLWVIGSGVFSIAAILAGKIILG